MTGTGAATTDRSRADLEYKTAGSSAVIGADDSTGVVEAIVSVTGIEDHVGDVIQPGAYAKTLARRRPKGIFAHDWAKPVARTEEVRELLPGDPRLPTLLPDGQPWPAHAGGLYVRARFNLDSASGRDAYSNVRFFSETGESEWSVGYRVPKGKATRTKDGKRHIYEMDLYEYSPVLFGANPSTSTLSVKAEPGEDDDPEDPGNDSDNPAGTDTGADTGSDATEERLHREAMAEDAFTDELEDAPEAAPGGDAAEDTRDGAEAYEDAPEADPGTDGCEEDSEPENPGEAAERAPAGEGKRDIGPERRRQMAKEGAALPDGSYPISTVEDLKNAVQAFGRAKPEDRPKVKRHIIKRARALGRTDLLPDDWNPSRSQTPAGAQTSKQVERGLQHATEQYAEGWANPRYHEGGALPVGEPLGEQVTGKVAGQEASPRDVAATERLKHWYVRGEGAAKIRWGEEGDFMRCVRLASKHMTPEQAKGFCNLRHQDALGVAPGQEGPRKKANEEGADWGSADETWDLDAKGTHHDAHGQPLGRGGGMSSGRSRVQLDADGNTVFVLKLLPNNQVLVRTRDGKTKTVAASSLRSPKAADSNTTAGAGSSGKALESTDVPRLPGTYEELREHLTAELTKALTSDAPDVEEFVTIAGTWPDRVVATRYLLAGAGMPAKGDSFEVPYALDEDGTPVLGDPEPVELAIHAAGGDDEQGDAKTGEDPDPRPALVDAVTEQVQLLLLADDGFETGPESKSGQGRQETKAGRVLSGANEKRLRGAVEQLVAVLQAAGIDISIGAPDQTGATSATDAGANDTTAPSAKTAGDGLVLLDPAMQARAYQLIADSHS